VPGSQGSGHADVAGGACNVTPQSFTSLGQNHLAPCAPVSYAENPPAGGDHYWTWADFASYAFPVPRGFWVHDLEHGAVVFGYNCPGGCADEVAEVQALIDGLPVDPLCTGATPRRVVLTPDPLLDVRWGLSAWGYTLRADCVDVERFRSFYLNHFGLAPEQLCATGSNFDGVPPCP